MVVKTKKDPKVKNPKELISELRKLLGKGPATVLPHETIISLSIKLKSQLTSLNYNKLAVMPEEIATFIDAIVNRKIQNTEELFTILNKGLDHIEDVLNKNGEMSRGAINRQLSIISMHQDFLNNSELNNESEKVEETSSTIRVSELIVQNIEDMKSQIDDLLKQKKEVVIVAEDVTAIDLSYIQLILSMKKAKMDPAIDFEFKGELKPNISEMLEKTGFSGIV